MPDRWAVPLDGEAEDIEEAKRLFVEGPIRIREVEIGHDKQVVALQADEFERKDDFIEVLAAAGRLFDRINGVLFLGDAERRPLRPLTDGTVRERGEAGAYSRQSVSVSISDGVRASATISAVHVAADGRSFVMEGSAEPGLDKRLAALCISDEAAAEILTHLRGDPDHAALYMAYERLKRDVVEAKERWNASGQKGAPPEFPWADREDKEFTRSAQPFRHGDPEKWAGKTHGTAMSLPEARVLVSGWIRKWLERKRPNP